MIFDSMAAIRSFENPISMRRSPAASGSRPLRITKSSMNHLSLRDPLSQASDGVVAAHLSVVTFATKSAPRNTPLPRTHQGSSCGRVADRGARSAAACDAGDWRHPRNSAKRQLGNVGFVQLALSERTKKSASKKRFNPSPAAAF